MTEPQNAPWTGNEIKIPHLRVVSLIPFVWGRPDALERVAGSFWSLVSCLFFFHVINSRALHPNERAWSEPPEAGGEGTGNTSAVAKERLWTS